MKKSTRNIMIVIIILLLIVCLISFNVNGIKKIFNNSNIYYTSYEEAAVEDYAMAYPVVETQAANASMKMMASNDAVSFGGGYENGNSTDRKIIKNINIDCETDTFDNTYDLIKKKVSKYRGEIDSESFNNDKVNNKTRRSCYFNIRIPQDNVDMFVGEVTANVNVLNKYVGSQDVTDNYYDTKARLDNLKIEESKLQDLMKEASKVEDVIIVEERLSKVRNEIESIERRIKNLDKQIDYCSINISLIEVVVFTKVEDTKPTKSALIKAFKKNFDDTKRFIVNTGYYIFTHIPAICFIICSIMLILIVVVIVLTIIDNKDEKEDKKEIKVEKSIDKKALEEKPIEKKELSEEEKREIKKAKKEIDDGYYYSDDDVLSDGKEHEGHKIEDVEDDKPYKKDADGNILADLDFTSTK